MRSIGAHYDHSALGYSSHVRIATLGRFFILLSSPMIGYVTDVYSDPILILKIGSTLCLFYSISSFFILRYVKLNSYEKLFLALNPRTNFIKKKSINVVVVNRFSRLFLMSFFAFAITSTGIILVNTLASYFSEYRATIVQMSAIVTTLGTMIHIFFIDPVLSKKADESFESSIQSIYEHVRGRLYASLFLLSLYILVIFIQN